jgi:hypothetical protein
MRLDKVNFDHDGHKKTARIMHFDGPADLADTSERLNKTKSEHYLGDFERGSDSDGWWGEDLKAALKHARLGDATLVPEAEKLVEQFMLDAPEVTRNCWQPSPCGAYPIVPEALAGIPTSMRRQNQVADDRAPIRIIVDLTVSAGIDHETIRERGAVLLAFVMMASKTRQLSLEVITGLDCNDASGALAVVPINTQPLDLAGACNALTSTAFFRRLMYNCSYRKIEAGGGWAFGRPESNNSRCTHALCTRKALGLEDRDLLIGPLFMTDKMIKNPQKWLSERIAEINNVELEVA